MGSTSRQLLRRYATYFLAWTVVGIFYFSQDVTRSIYWQEPVPFWEAFASRMIGAYLCAAFTPAILWLGRRWPIDRESWPRRTALHLVLSAGFSVVEIAIESGVFVQLGMLSQLLKDSIPKAFHALMVVGFHGNVIAYWIILGIQSGLQYYRQYREGEQQALRLELHTSELKTQLMRAQLSALKMQLQPHFLFNTLNAIMVLVRQQKGREAEETLSRFSDLLRLVLEDVEAQEVPLRRELEYLRLYLSIEQVRFRDRLQAGISVDPEVLEAAVPHMALQPIVENAVRHGIGRSAAAGQIRISASRIDGTLEIKVEDDGPGLRPVDLRDGSGIGLANTRARLHQLYGEGAKLTIENGEEGGVVVTMLLPYHLAGENSETGPMEAHAINNLDR